MQKRKLKRDETEKSKAGKAAVVAAPSGRAISKRKRYARQLVAEMDRTCVSLCVRARASVGVGESVYVCTCAGAMSAARTKYAMRSLPHPSRRLRRYVHGTGGPSALRRLQPQSAGLCGCADGHPDHRPRAGA